MRLITLALLLLLGAAGVQAEKPKEFIITPTGNRAGPFPVAVWLHGYRGYSPDGYAEEADMQRHADALGAVILGFPATTDLGDETQQWSEEPVADHAYVQDRLQKLAKIHKLDLSRVGLFGFSLGGKMAAELATHFPGSYLGAILLSPGGLGTPQIAEEKRPEHARQVFYSACGGGENPRTLMYTQAYAPHLKKVLGAQVTTKIYVGVTVHKLPPDFTEKFPEWMAAILKVKAP